MKIINLFLLLVLCTVARSQNDQTKFIDKYGVTIIIDGDIKFIKPVDKEFLIRNINSKLIQSERDSMTQYLIREITKTKRNTYRVKITYLFCNAEERMNGHLNTYYKLVVAKVNSKYLATEFQYEEMEF